MMNYVIDIIDTLDSNVVLSVEKALASSVKLSWKGGDRKDELFIVGSSLSFTMLGPSVEDGQYMDLFTGDETRFKVRLYDSDNTTIWSGFLLPDAYSEPYQNAPIPINFQAVDGLGRLKGKYLPEDFYKEEKSVIQILSKCLELTGLGLALRFAPAIENSQQKDYNQIYLDTSLFKENDKRQDAHKILDDLLKSMLCTLYQADDFYNIEGLNVRNMFSYEAKIYSNGVLQSTVTVNRLVKSVDAISGTNIQVQPPYGIVNISHQQEPLKLPEGLVQVENEGWGAETKVYGLDWMGSTSNNDLPLTDKDLNVLLSYWDTPNIALRQKPYIHKGQKVKVKIGLKAILTRESGYFKVTNSEIEALIADGKWTDPLAIILTIGSVNVFSNIENISGAPVFDIQFNKDKTAEVELQFISKISGPFDIYMAAPGVDSQGAYTNTSEIKAVQIDELSLEVMGHKDEFLSEFTKDGYTLKKEETLTYADDYKGLGSAFRLDRLNDEDTNYSEIEVEVVRQFQRNGETFLTVDLKGANAIAHEMSQVTYNGSPFDVQEVIYNYNNSYEHVLRCSQTTSGKDAILTVRIYGQKPIYGDRKHWQQWSDSIYKVEQKRYADAANDVYTRLHSSPIFILDSPVYENIKFNDIIHFPFYDVEMFTPSSVTWDIDKGTSQVIAGLCHYNGNVGDNLAPVVEAGDDVFINVSETEAQISCQAHDPNGDSLEYQWELLQGSATMDNSDTPTVSLSNLTGSEYELKVTVTDAIGETDSDTVMLYKEQNTTLNLTKTFESDTGGRYIYELSFSPAITQGYSLNIMGRMNVDIKGVGSNGIVRIYQNEVLKEELNVSVQSGEDYIEGRGDYSLNYQPGDLVTMEVWADSSGYARSEFTIDVVEFMDGHGIVSGVPASKHNQK